MTESKSKTTKKSPAKATTAKAAKAKGELTERETAVLTALNKAAKPLNRAQLKEKSGVKGGLSKILGAATKDDLGAGGKESLQGRGFVKAEKYEGEAGMVFSITAAGKKALAAGK